MLEVLEFLKGLKMDKTESIELIGGEKYNGEYEKIYKKIKFKGKKYFEVERDSGSKKFILEFYITEKGYIVLYEKVYDYYTEKENTFIHIFKGYKISGSLVTPWESLEGNYLYKYPEIIDMIKEGGIKLGYIEEL